MQKQPLNRNTYRESQNRRSDPRVSDPRFSWSLKRATLILILLVFPFAGCSEIKNETPDPELEENFRLWREKKVSDYDFVITKYHGTANYMQSLIRVRNSQVISNEMIGDKPMNTYLEIDDFDTVEGAFALIKASHEKSLPVRVTYNKTYHYPEKTIIDTSPGRTDHVMSIWVSEFTVY